MARSAAFVAGRGALPLACLVMAACASTPPPVEECDPTRNLGVITAARCDAGGTFDARLQQLEQEIARVREETGVTQEEINRLNTEAERLQSQGRSVSDQLARQRLQISALDGELQSLQAGNAEQKRLVEEMRSEARAARDAYSEIKARNDATTREVAE